MRVSICLDDRNGMMFNKRRQSKDKMVVQDILECAEGNIYIHPYSEVLFQEASTSYYCNEAFLDFAEDGTCCFVENKSIEPYMDKIKEVHLYRWNRHYPSDMKFEIDLSKYGFQMVNQCEFEGTSHDKITKEVWVCQQNIITDDQEK